MIEVSVFDPPVGNTTKFINCNFEELTKRLEKPRLLPDNSAETKARHGAYFIRGVVDGSRNDANLRDCSLLILDIDKPVNGGVLPTPYQIHDALGDINHAVYSSVTPGRSRIVVPVKPYKKEQTEPYTKNLYGFCREVGLEFSYAGESAAKSQPFFYGQTLDVDLHVCLVNDNADLFNPADFPVDDDDTGSFGTSSEHPRSDNPLKEFSAEIMSGTLHVAAKRYAGWLTKTTNLTIGQIFNDITILVDLMCPDHDIVTRWHQYERAELEKWFVGRDFDRYENDVTEKSSIVAHRASDLTPRPIAWEEKPLIAREKVHLLAARGGSLKSSLLIDWAARKTSGSRNVTETGYYTSGNVLFITTEDDPEDTLLPRFIEAGGNRERLTFISHEDYLPDINTREGELDEFLAESEHYDWVILDPVTSMTGDANTHVDAIVKGICAKLSVLAKKYNTAFIGILHFRKGNQSEGDLVDMVSGSAGWVNSARIAMACFLDDKTGLGYLGIIKSNIGTKNLTLFYKPSIEVPDWHNDDVVKINYTGQDTTPISRHVKVLSGRDSKQKKEEKMHDLLVGKYGDFFRENQRRAESSVLVRDYVRKNCGYRISNDDLKKAEKAGGYVLKPAGQGKGWKMHSPHCVCEGCNQESNTQRGNILSLNNKT